MTELSIASIRANIAHYQNLQKQYQKLLDEAKRKEVEYQKMLPRDHNPFRVSEYTNGTRTAWVEYLDTEGHYITVGVDSSNDQRVETGPFVDEFSAEDWCEDWVMNWLKDE